MMFPTQRVHRKMTSPHFIRKKARFEAKEEEEEEEDTNNQQQTQ